MNAKDIATKIIAKEIKPLCFNGALGGYDSSDTILNSDTYKSFVEKLSTRPELQGSEKQIAWAKEIREKYISKSAFDLTVTLINMWEEAIKDGMPDLQEPFITNFNKRAKAAINNSKAPSAAFIIENMR